MVYHFFGCLLLALLHRLLRVLELLRLHLLEPRRVVRQLHRLRGLLGLLEVALLLLKLKEVVAGLEVDWGLVVVEVLLGQFELRDILLALEQERVVLLLPGVLVGLVAGQAAVLKLIHDRLLVLLLLRWLEVREVLSEVYFS